MDLGDAVEELRRVYLSPPFDDEYRTYSRRAYLELCLTVGESLRGDEKSAFDPRTLYAKLSGHALAEIDPARGGVGITEIVYSDSTLAVDGQNGELMVFSTGYETTGAYSVLRHFEEDDVRSLAKAFDQ